LCGRVPFGSSSYVALSHQHMYAPPPPFASWLPQTSGALQLEPIVLRCLAKNPEERFPSAQALARALAPHRAPDKTLRLPRGAAQARAQAAAASLRARELGGAARGVRLGKLLHWAVVGCCLGALMLVLVYWLAVGRG